MREPWAGASADTWSEATSRSKDTRARRKTWRAEHRANGQGSPGEENGFPGMPSSAGSGGGGTPENVHLHLEVFNVRGKSKESVIDEESDKIWNNSFDRWNARKDPLNNMK